MILDLVLGMGFFKLEMEVSPSEGGKEDAKELEMVMVRTEGR